MKTDALRRSRIPAMEGGLSMRKRVLLIALGSLVALLVVPAVVTQFVPSQSPTRTPIALDSLAYEEIRFENTSQGVSLAGMLFVPEGEPPFPAVVIIHGSGPSSRTRSWYLDYASYLQASGILVLLPDKRGCDSSGGDWRTASLQDLATDTQAAITYLRTERPELVQSIGILGNSQGGVIAPIVGAEESSLAFVINVVGHAVPMYDQLTFEENYNLREMGILPGFSNALSYVTTFVQWNFTNRGFWSIVGNFDSLTYWREVEVPTLVIFGERDTNVPSFRSRDRLNSLGKPNIRVVMFEDSGHDLEAPPGVGGEYHREDALAMIRDFILETASER
jgi:dipeptidyl aminopeptidase/acylaminoacyl peptidase